MLGDLRHPDDVPWSSSQCVLICVFLEVYQHSPGSLQWCVLSRRSALSSAVSRPFTTYSVWHVVLASIGLPIFCIS